jgi:GntR family transcriptional regulator
MTRRPLAFPGGTDDLRDDTSGQASVTVDHWNADRPSYVQLADLLRARIKDGTYPVRGLLPSIRQLAEEYELAAGTVRHGISILVDEGLVRNVVGRGCQVIAKPGKGPP